MCVRDEFALMEKSLRNFHRTIPATHVRAIIYNTHSSLIQRKNCYPPTFKRARIIADDDDDDATRNNSARAEALLAYRGNCAWRGANDRRFVLCSAMRERGMHLIIHYTHR